jgi:homoserine O-succinyltransferase/O-acetyltransferase
MGGRRTCALLNNMPDGAFNATERQFADLLAASGPVDLRRYVMAGVPRGERTAARIKSDYEPVEALWDDPPDFLIVTGSEPITERIEDEAYWAELVRVLEWGSEHVGSMLLSCLAAHAALAVFDGVARTRMSSKCTGVFAQTADPAHPLNAGLDEPIVLPHSRLNTVPTPAVRAAGYQVAMESERTGWSVITRRVGHSDVVLVQGHPEYDPSSLLREYNRDMTRYVTGERDQIPFLPVDCVGGADWDALEQLHAHLAAGERDPALATSFPFADMCDRAVWPWRPVATTLYGNWLGPVRERSL